MSKITIVTLVAGLALTTTSGCSSPFMEAEDAVRAQVKDGRSTEFRNVAFCGGKPGSVVKGEFNSKNSFGAYAGYENFYYDNGIVEFGFDGGPTMERCTAQMSEYIKVIEAETAAIRASTKARSQ